MKRRNSSTARSTRLQSSSSQSRRSGFFKSSWTDPLMRWVVVSCPANNSRNTMATISSGLICPPSLDAHDLGDQPFAALLANDLKMPFHIAFHGKDVRDHAQESARTRKTGEAAGP